jgi:hypothetical protein
MREANPGKRREDFGVGQNLEVAVQGRARVAEPRMDLLEGPALAGFLEQIEQPDHPFQAARLAARRLGAPLHRPV